jgi:hypothetical protein
VQVGVDPLGPCLEAGEQPSGVEVAEQAGVEQLRVPVEELLEAGGGPAFAVRRDALDPGARDRLVELGGLAVCGRDLTNRRGDGVGRLAGVVHSEVAPGELDVLAVAEAVAATEDVVQYLPVLAVHGAILAAQRGRLTLSTTKIGRGSAKVAAQLMYRGSLCVSMSSTRISPSGSARMTSHDSCPMRLDRTGS